MENIIVTIKVNQTDNDNNSENIEFMSEARLYKKKDIYYISYKESEISGMDKTNTTIKISEGNVDIIRFGDIETNLKFIQDKEYICEYKTPYGILQMSILPNKVAIDVNEESGHVFLDYEVKIDGQKISNNIFELSFK